VTGDSVIVSRISSSGYSFMLLPGGAAVTAPSARATPISLGGGVWAWFDNETGKLTASDGTRVLWQRPAGPVGGGTIMGRDGAVTASWSGGAMAPYDVAPWNTYFGAVGANGKLTGAFSIPANIQLRGVTPISAGAIIGNVGIDESGNFDTLGLPSHFHVALIDFATAQVHPIPEISAGLAGFNAGKNEHAFVSGAMVGSFVRVDAGGDCLNVRETASTGAKSLGCFKDGVLLPLVDEGSTGGWYHVTTPAGVAGWASAEFLAP
jgi:hypothetical protein